MSKKLLLFDGHSIANRAFYGLPLLGTKEGIYTNAILGFMNIMLSFIEKEKPDYLGIAFDLSTPTFRHKFSSDYKGTRKGMPQELRSQIPLLKKLLEAMHIQMISKEGYEADDLLGTLAKLGEKDGMQVTVVSGDRDLFQVTSDCIAVKIPRTKKTGTEIESFFAKDVMDVYGVTPTAFIDVKGLMGDVSDNIKGVKGIGEKTAIKLIKTYGSIENLLEHVEELTQKKLKENLITYAQDARDSKMLATIVCDVPLETSWEDFTYDLTLDQGAFQILKELELKSLLKRLNHQEEESTIPLEVKMLEVKDFRDFLKASENQEVNISYFMEDNILGLGLVVNAQNYYLEWDITDLDAKAEIIDFLESSRYIKNIHDSKVLRHYLITEGIGIAKVGFDTLIAAYLLHPTMKSYDLSELAERLDLALSMPSIEALLGKGKSMIKWLALDEKVRVQNMVRRAEAISALTDKMKEALRAEKMEELFYHIEMPLIEVLFEMELAGISVDTEGLKQYGEDLTKLIQSLESEIYELAGESFNINSPKQLGVILFEKLSIPGAKKTKTGYSTSADVLEALKKDYPIVDKILEYRQYAKLKSTYVDGLLNVMTKDAKIHSTFNQTITATGRLSSTEPNLQNIPVKFEMGRKIRQLFVPSSSEYVFLDGDYSQIELRVLAHISGDETLIKGFNENLDIHTLTASQVFHVPFDEVTSLQRSNAKAVNFGIVYGMSAFALAEDLKISQKEAQAYIDGYFAKYPNIKEYIDTTIDFAMQHGFVGTMFNRKREIPDLFSSMHRVREFGKRVAMNTPIQGTAADIIKIAMVKVHEKLKALKLKSKLILTVHDELLIETHVSEVEVVKKLLKEEMENAVTLSVPLYVDVHEGKNWLDVK